MRGKTRKPAVFQITGASRSMSEDIQARQRRYVASMLFRTACFGGVIFTHGVLRFVLFLGALLLPYIAVVLANAGRERAKQPPTTQLSSDRAALGVGSPPDPADDPAGGRSGDPADQGRAGSGPRSPGNAQAGDRHSANPDQERWFPAVSALAANPSPAAATSPPEADSGGNAPPGTPRNRT